MAGSIGIKQANGNFYAILKENSDAKKRLVLTTVHDSQKSVQIDLYRSAMEVMSDAEYIGSIVVENISPKPKGDPSIEMTLSAAGDGSISACAVDLANPENEHHLSVSLASLEEDKNEYPDFELNDTGKTQNSEPQVYAKKFPLGILVAAGILLALLLGALWFFLFRNKPEAEQSAVIGRARSQTSMVIREAEPLPVITEPQISEPPVPVTEAPIQSEPPKTVVVETPPKANPQAAARDRPPASLSDIPRTIPPEGITYRIKWGDTLWNISEAFYRNPRLYTYIARSNGIRNPNHIVSGTNLTIRPRN